MRRPLVSRGRILPLLGADEGDADLTAESPDHLALPADAFFAGDQQVELVGYLDAVGKQPRTLLGNIGDHAVARQRAGFRLEFGDPVDAVAPALATFVQHEALPTFSDRA